MISCSEAVRQLWSYLDGALDDSDNQAMNAHLDVCRRCCGEVEFATELQTFLTDHAREDIPPQVRQRFERFLEEI